MLKLDVEKTIKVNNGKEFIVNVATIKVNDIILTNSTTSLCI